MGHQGAFGFLTPSGRAVEWASESLVAWAAMEAGQLPGAYALAPDDAVREQLEAAQLARTARALVARGGTGQRSG